MKFLCLHGAGTNADILQSQLMPIYNALSKESAVKFDFIEGEHESAPAEEITRVYQGPYLSFYPWPPRMQEKEYVIAQEEAYELIYETIESEGPFDAILGFSQGASLAYLFLQQHARKHPYDLPWSLFRCAVFVCGMPPFRIQDDQLQSQDEDSTSLRCSVDAEELSQRLLSIASKPSLPPLYSEESISESGSKSCSDEPSFSSKASSSTAYSAWSTTSPGVHDASTKIKSDVLDNLVFDEDLRALHIPSLHIAGKGDKVYDLTRKLYEGMNKDNAMWIEHEHGHTIPWDKKNTNAFVEAIRELERRALLT